MSSSAESGPATPYPFGGDLPEARAFDESAAVILPVPFDRTTGVPTPLPGSPFATGGSFPNPAVIDRSGRFMYVGQSVGSFDGSLAVLAIDAATGALSHIPGSPFPNVANGGNVAVDGFQRIIAYHFSFFAGR